MTYASQADLKQRFGEAQLKLIADRDADGTLDAAVVARALEDADEEINGYVGVSVPQRPVALAADIAFYRLHPEAHPEDVRTRYTDAVRFLHAVATGNATLDVAGAEPEPAGGGQVQHTAPDRVFTRDSLADF